MTANFKLSILEGKEKIWYVKLIYSGDLQNPIDCMSFTIWNMPVVPHTNFEYKCLISSFGREVNENCALLGHYERESVLSPRSERFTGKVGKKFPVFPA